MGSGAATPKPISFIIQIIRWWYPFPRHGLLSSKQRLKRWKGATGITRIQIFQPYSLRRHYHICLKATLWNTLQRDHCKELNWNLVTTLQLLRLRHPTSVSKRGLYENQGVGSQVNKRRVDMNMTESPDNNSITEP